MFRAPISTEIIPSGRQKVQNAVDSWKNPALCTKIMQPQHKLYFQIHWFSKLSDLWISAKIDAFTSLVW
jgi:hypothetical protein